MTTKDFPLMRKATAVWLVDNTSLLFQQIADFCGLHILEVQGIADGDVAYNMIGANPITGGQLSWEEIHRCEKDKDAKLKLIIGASEKIKVSKKGKYTPIATRSDKPDGIAFILKYYPNMSDAQIRKLIGTTKNMIESIKDRSYWNIKNVTQRDPVLLGLCTQSQFNEAVEKIKIKEDSSN